MDGDSSAKFIGSLTKFLQSLCNGYVEFQRGVELVGHIYLSIDTGEKVDYILHEKVSKNDENSVTFVSNSFHAQPQDKDKAKEPPATGNAKAGKSENLQADDDDDDDDDIMIVDQSSQGVIGSTNSGSISSRGVKRMSSPGSDHRHGQRVRISLGSSSSSAHNMSGHSYGSGNRQHSGRPSATVTSQGASQNENLNISEVKLEQISKDELLSLASQVGDGTSGPSQTSSAASHSQSQLSGSSRGDAAMWVKQEVPDDGGGTDAGWPQERDDSNSNSGSNLYPVMLHPNPSAFPPSSIPGYSGPSGSGNQPAFPMPGSSQDMSGLDPAERIGWTRRCRTSFSHYQIKTLEKEFDQGQYLTRPRRCFLAKKLGLTERHITIWFQNRRQKVKKEQHQGSGEKDFSRPSQPPNQSLWLHDSASKEFSTYHQSSAQFPPPQSPDVQDLSKHNQSPYQSRPSQSPGSDEIRRYGRSPNQFQPPQSPGVQDLSRPSQSPFHSRPSPSPGYRFGQSPSQSQPPQSPGYRYSHSPSHSQPSHSPGVKDLSMHSQSPSQSLSSQSPDVKDANSFQPPYRSQLSHSPNNRELGSESPKHFLQSQSPCGKDYSQSSNQSLESQSSSGKDFLYSQSPSQPQQAEGAPGKELSSDNQSPKQLQCKSPSRREDANQDQSPDQAD